MKQEDPKKPKRAADPKRGGMKTGFWRWEYEGAGGTAALERAPLFGRTTASAVVAQWELEARTPVRKRIDAAVSFTARNAKWFGAIMLAFALGIMLANGPNSIAAATSLRAKLHATESSLKARQGELELVKLEMARMASVMEHSQEHQIPADLAASIYDIALAEGIEPKVAFGLVAVESEFYRKAVSPQGAVGLTQLMPSTAKLLKPDLTRADLFDRETNLRLGFRYLREMLRYYKGDLHLALTAYNRGPGTVDGIRKSGGDPSNGYSGNVLKTLQD